MGRMKGRQMGKRRWGWCYHMRKKLLGEEIIYNKGNLKQF